jgi:CheY-specific phosphatase CheX
MKNMNDLMMDAIFEVFEKMFYIFLEPLAVDGRRGELAATIRFDGDPAGWVQMNLSQGMAAQMAKNMLGFEETCPQEVILHDCTKEALNMICGNFLRKLVPDGVFKLSLPEVTEAGPENVHDDYGHTVMEFLFESEGEWVGIDAVLRNGRPIGER